jgi:phosphopantothenoylcysteine decarboxylase
MKNNNKKIKVILGVTGSVAAIKTVELYTLITSWAEVKVIATPSALHFLNTIPNFNLPLINDQQEWQQWQKIGDPVLHIELKKWADILVIAPLSANTLSKLSFGECDNLLTSVCRAWSFDKPICIAPAMNTMMWEHPITAESLTRLTKWGYQIIEPISKTLACGDEGIGAMAEPSSINFALKKFI